LGQFNKCNTLLQKMHTDAYGVFPAAIFATPKSSRKGPQVSRPSRSLLQKMNPIPGKSISTDDELLQQNAGTQPQFKENKELEKLRICLARNRP